MLLSHVSTCIANVAFSHLTTTGFSPFELVFGREVQGPLDILKEEWEAGKRASESVVSHVLLLRERLESMSELRYRFNATSQFRACASARTREPERHHTRAQVVPHSSSRSTTCELERYHMRVRVVSLSSPRIATRSAIALAQTPDLLFSAFLS